MTHFHFGSGLHGCLYDYGPHYAETVQEAVLSLAELFELSRFQKKVLERDRYLSLGYRRHGAQYCDITTCDDPNCQLEQEDS